MNICYDPRFPHLFRDLAVKDHWHNLLQARAIEKGCYIIVPTRYGYYFNKRKSYRDSLKILPWGKILKDAKIDNYFMIKIIYKNEIKKSRSKSPSIFVNKTFKVN